MLRHRSPARTFLSAATLAVVLAAGGSLAGCSAASGDAPTTSPTASTSDAAVVAPALARRLAQAKREAEAAARQAETARRAEEFAANAIIPGVQSRAGEHRAFDTATRHTGTILPRLYAMSMRLSPWPILPIPGFGPPQQVGVPLRSKLHSRREVRDALVAQVFLQPAKGLADR